MLNASLVAMGEYASKSIARRVESDPGIVSLSLGEPDFGPPAGFAERLESIIPKSSVLRDLKRYESSRGAATLRESIAAYHKNYFGVVPRSDDEILVTPGGAGALTVAILAATEAGDEVLIGDPSYMLYERLVRVLGRVPRRVIRHASEDYRFDIELLRSLLTARTAALIINSPENPTGYVCSESEMIDLVDFCRSRGVTLIHDEAYDQFTFACTHRPACAFGGLEGVIQINSTSKKFGVPGLRLGWLAASPQTVAVAAKAQDYTSLAVSAVAERIAQALLEHPGLSSWFAEIRTTLYDRVRQATASLSAIPGLEFCSTVRGGMFVFPRVDGLAKYLGLDGPRTAGELVTNFLLDEAKVAVVPGLVYGPSGKDSIRLVLCGPKDALHEGLSRIECGVAAFAKA